MSSTTPSPPAIAATPKDTEIAVDVDELARRLCQPREVIEHSVRFRRVSTRYAHVVTQAYAGDPARAAGDSDERVAATVAVSGNARTVTSRAIRTRSAERNAPTTSEEPPARRATRSARAPMGVAR